MEKSMRCHQTMHDSNARMTARPEKSVEAVRAAAPLEPVFDVLEVVGDEVGSLLVFKKVMSWIEITRLLFEQT